VEALAKQGVIGESGLFANTAPRALNATIVVGVTRVGYGLNLGSNDTVNAATTGVARPPVLIDATIDAKPTPATADVSHDGAGRVLSRAPEVDRKARFAARATLVEPRQLFVTNRDREFGAIEQQRLQRNCKTFAFIRPAQRAREEAWTVLRFGHEGREGDW